jgi:hypothetical protein
MIDVESESNVAASASSTLPRTTHVSKVPSKDHVLLDSGTTHHFTGRGDLMVNTKGLHTPMPINTLGGIASATETGTLQISKKAQLTQVKFVKQAPYTLMSVARACDAGLNVTFTKEGAWIYHSSTIVNLPHIQKPGNHIVSFNRINNLYVHLLDVTHKNKNIQAKDNGDENIKRRRFSNSSIASDDSKESAHANATTRSMKNNNSNSNSENSTRPKTSMPVPAVNKSQDSPVKQPQKSSKTKRVAFTQPVIQPQTTKQQKQVSRDDRLRENNKA